MRGLIFENMHIQKLSTLSLNDNLARYIILSCIYFSLLILKALLQYDIPIRIMGSRASLPDSNPSIYYLCHLGKFVSSFVPQTFSPVK